MATHYILADDYDRWSPGEPIEDISSNEEYLHQLYATSISRTTFTFQDWLNRALHYRTIIKVTTDTEGRIIP